jgi:hypothetical protein
MDKETLVKSDIEIGGLIVDALSQARMPVTLCDWRYVPELEEWQLVIATPWHDKHGPHETYLRLIDALQKAGIYEEVPMRRVFLVSPNDPVVQELEQEIRTRSEGFIHIIRHIDRQRDSYSVIFAPISGAGGAVPTKHVSSLQSLREFLIYRLHLKHSSVEDALAEIGLKGSSSIFPVHLTARLTKQLGLG